MVKVLFMIQMQYLFFMSLFFDSADCQQSVVQLDV